MFSLWLTFAFATCAFALCLRLGLRLCLMRLVVDVFAFVLCLRSTMCLTERVCVMLGGLVCVVFVFAFSLTAFSCERALLSAQLVMTMFGDGM